MRKLFILTLFLFLLSLTFLSADTYQQTQEVDLKISCLNVNCSEAVNISIVYPNSSLVIDNQETTLGSGFVNYTFSDTNTLGEYKFLTNNGYEGTFQITPSGTEFTNALSIPLFIPMTIMILIMLLFFFMAGFMKKKEYKFTFIILGGIFLIFAIAFGIIASREVLFGFPLLYGFVNSFYRIFIITLQILGITIPIIVAIFVIKRAFNTRGYNIGK